MKTFMGFITEQDRERRRDSYADYAGEIKDIKAAMDPVNRGPLGYIRGPAGEEVPPPTATPSEHRNDPFTKEDMKKAEQRMEDLKWQSWERDHRQDPFTRETFPAGYDAWRHKFDARVGPGAARRLRPRYDWDQRYGMYPKTMAEIEREWQIQANQARPGPKQSIPQRMADLAVTAAGYSPPALHYKMMTSPTVGKVAKAALTGHELFSPIGLFGKQGAKFAKSIGAADYSDPYPYDSPEARQQRKDVQRKAPTTTRDPAKGLAPRVARTPREEQEMERDAMHPRKRLYPGGPLGRAYARGGERR